jgi:soluble P-type ATPase
MKYSPKGIDGIELDTIILDLNGTIAVNGVLVDGLKDRLNQLKNLGFKIYLFTGDQRGNARDLARDTGIEVQIATSAEEKESLTQKLDVDKTVAIGNARIDIGTFKHTKLRIATLQAEGMLHSTLKPNTLDNL